MANSDPYSCRFRTKQRSWGENGGGGAEGERRAGKHLTLPFTANKRCYKYTNCISVQLACLGIKSK